MKISRFLSAFFVLHLTCTAAIAEAGPQGTACGRWVTAAKKPVADGLVLFFDDSFGPPPLPERYWRAADETGMTDGSGHFCVDLPAGNYYVGTMKRTKGTDKGPLRAGDIYTLSQDGKGRPRLFPVRPGETTDVGTIRGGSTYRNAYRMEGMTAIRGTVRDDQGRPAAGVLVLAYPTADMGGRPLYVSDRTGKDGTFLLRLGSAGEYYLKIRSNYGGGQPEAGEMMGGYGEFGNPAAVAVTEGTIVSDIDIGGIRFPGRGQRRP